jgi:sulfate adenylyltransferase
MHGAHQELTLRAAKAVKANPLIHPVVGMTKPGDVDHYARVRGYQAVLSHSPKHTVKLTLRPLAMRVAGPREAVWHALIRKNYGCTHFIVGRDHAGPGYDSSGTPFDDPYAAQKLLREHEKEIGVRMVPLHDGVCRGAGRPSFPKMKCLRARGRCTFQAPSSGAGS